MDDLSHWNFAADFSAAEVVALAFGLDMNRLVNAADQDQLTLERARFTPALERMRQCYGKARVFYEQCMSPPEHPSGEPIEMLCSVEMASHLAEHDVSDGSHCYFYHWVTNDELSGFTTQRFARDTIANWLSAIGQKSQYTFALNQAIQGQQSPIAAVTPLNPDSKPSSREVTTYLNIIGALLEFVQHPRSGRDSDAAVIRELEANYGDKPGISKRTLEDKFSLAKKSLQSV